MKQQTTGWRTFTFVTLMLLVFWWGLFPPTIEQQPYQLLDVTLQSTYSANYATDPLPTRPGVSAQIVLETIKESEPDIDPEALAARQTAFEAGLLTPISTVAGGPTFTPSPTPTVTPSPTPTLTPSPTPTFTPSPTPTVTSSPTPTLTPSPTSFSTVRHEIVTGDTLWDLARTHTTTVEAIRKLNPSLGVLNIGETIVLPAPINP